MNNDLKTLQEKLISMIFIIDEFCKKYNIEYQLEGGTALGAYRHHGIIPWDDDIDISMDIKEYKRFCKLFIANPPKGMALQIHKTDKNYVNGYGKIRDLNSITAEERIGAEYKYQGLFVDVFPYEEVNPTLLKVSHLFFHRIQFSIIRKRFKQSSALSLILNFFYYLSVIGDSFIRILTKFTPTTYSYTYGCNIYAKMGQWRQDTFWPTKEMVFEGKKLPVPGKVEDFLEAKYGNYMELPPEEERNHVHYLNYKIFDIE